MQPISIADLSARALGRLKQGYKVRVAHGSGMELLVDPAKYNQITKTFMKGKGLHLQLSPEEIHHNHARGIFGKLGDRVLSGLNKLTGHDVGAAAYKLGDMIKPMAKSGLSSAISSGANMLAETNPELAPLIYLAKPFIERGAQKYMDNPGGSSSSAKAAPPSRQVESRTEGHAPRAKRSREIGHGLYAGGGLHPLMIHHHYHEVGSVGHGGNLLRAAGQQPPAMRSQPDGANYQFKNMLPPAYARIHTGAGLY